MDVVLEIVDTYFADYCYAKALPASGASLLTQGIQHVASSTFSSLREGATPAPIYSYQPSTSLFRIEPSQYAYQSAWPRDSLYRQTLSLFLITWIFGLVIYFVCSTASYYFIFDHATFTHPKYLKNQVRLEIKQSMICMPFLSLLTVPFFLAEVRGYAKLYDAPTSAPFAQYNYLQFPLFILFTDFWIYWIHRCLHHPAIYKHLHKPHHKWIMPTPFASHAFHPVDGLCQSIPYHIYPLLFPLQKVAYVALFVFINGWTIFIHDGEYQSNSAIINGAACHSLHHVYFQCNYGQYTTLWDRLGGSYRKPLNRVAKGKDLWERQTRDVEKIVKQVEGVDDRLYGQEAAQVHKKML